MINFLKTLVNFFDWVVNRCSPIPGLIFFKLFLLDSILTVLAFRPNYGRLVGSFSVCLN